MKFAFQDFDNLYLVMDLLNGGDLRYHLCKLDVFNEIQSSTVYIYIYNILIVYIEFFIACIILGLEYIHCNNIIHRDLKPENLVCDQNGYVRITDFGVAKEKRENNFSDTSGTPGYMAPEVLCAKNHTYAVDFFAIGIMGYEFMFGERPYQGNNRQAIKREVLAKQIIITTEELPDSWSKESADFFNLLLKRKQEQRLGYNRGINELKEHTWFKSFNWKNLSNKTMKSPFIPDKYGNFDKSYCEGTDVLGEDTLYRYEQHINKEGFEFKFMNYTYIDEDEVKAYLLTPSRNEQSNIDKNSITKDDKNKRNNTLNKTSPFKLLKKVCSLSNFPNLYSPKHKVLFNVNNIQNQPTLKKNLSNNNLHLNYNINNSINNNSKTNNNSNIINNKLTKESKSSLPQSPLSFNKPLLLRINSPTHKHIFENSNIFKPKSPNMNNTNSIMFLSNPHSTVNSPKNQSINMNNNCQIEPSNRNSKSSKRIKKEKDNSIVNTKDKAKRIMDKLNKKIILEDYLFIKNNKRHYPTFKKTNNFKQSVGNGLSHNSVDIEKKRLILPITKKRISKIESPKFMESKLSFYTNILKHNNSTKDINSNNVSNNTVNKCNVKK